MKMAKSLLSSSLSTKTKLLQQTGVSIYSTSNGFNEEEVKKVLQQFPGASVDLQKKYNGIGILTLNNPNKMNAFSGAMMLQLLERVIELENWTEGKGLIVHGANNMFCSGSDLNAVKALATPEKKIEERQKENGRARTSSHCNELHMYVPLVHLAYVGPGGMEPEFFGFAGKCLNH
uniref:ethylmalonyl-CoA decarboxylase-like n=1 Tax=Jaculus jaculus TaxID=51337 RepID=UPI001E1B4FE6|nr:ethylmalonyl-CoA decarboxylase-like [Jaculus jaculus]